MDAAARGLELRDAAWRRVLEALRAVPAGAPTLCEGWTAHHLAAHLWTIKHSVRGCLAMLASPALERRHLDAVVAGRGYDDLLTRLEGEDGHVPVMVGDRREGHRHALGEFFVHGEDVRRANDLPTVEVVGELAEALWLRAQVAGRQLNLTRRNGIMLRLPDGRHRVISAGRPRTIVTGEPGELLLWVHGRETAARVEVQRVG